MPTEKLAGLTAWMPGNAHDSEWAEYYRFLSAEFGVQIDTSARSSVATTSQRESGALVTSSCSGSKMQLPVNPDFTEVSRY